MPDFPVIDAHLHLWDPKEVDYPWLKDVPELNRAYLLSEYNEACGSVEVEAMAFLQCEADFTQALDEAKWVNRLAIEEPRIKTIIPWAPLEKGEDCRPFLDELKQMPLIKGIRRIIEFEEYPEFCLQPGFIRGVQILADYDYSFDICIQHHQMKNVIKLVEQCPKVDFVVDHIAKPDIIDHLFEPWKSDLKRLAEFPNVVCKMSGLVVEADLENWTKEDLKPYIDYVIECFGFDRLVFGGDWPVVTKAAALTSWIETLDWALTSYSEAEKKKLYHDNALRIYKMV
jgi:L-fuconolactonase